MKRAIIYFLVGTFLSSLFSYFFSSDISGASLYSALAFGLGWGMAYYVDHPDWALVKKMGLSLIGVFVLVVLGFVFFDFEIAIPSIIKFSTVFVFYYLLASFRDSKSLRF